MGRSFAWPQVVACREGESGACSFAGSSLAPPCPSPEKLDGAAQVRGGGGVSGGGFNDWVGCYCSAPACLFFQVLCVFFFFLGSRLVLKRRFPQGLPPSASSVAGYVGAFSASVRYRLSCHVTSCLLICGLSVFGRARSIDRRPGSSDNTINYVRLSHTPCRLSAGVVVGVSSKVLGVAAAAGFGRAGRDKRQKEPQRLDRSTAGRGGGSPPSTPAPLSCVNCVVVFFLFFLMTRSAILTLVASLSFYYGFV